MADYFVIERQGEGKVTEKMSRFLAFAIYVETVDEARAEIKKLQNRYHDARHICWAYMLRPDRSEWQLNDNGEPSGTAGKPILGQINSKNLTNVLVAVIRYFGGIKLGTSGLISAYREAACLALENAGVKQCHEMKTIKIAVDYEAIDGIMKIIKAENLIVTEKIFDSICTFTLLIRVDHLPRITSLITDRGGRMESVFPKN